MIDTTLPGIYITESGVAVQKQPIFITSPEWQMLSELSHETRKPIGTLLINLARAESIRLKGCAK